MSRSSTVVRRPRRTTARSRARRVAKRDGPNASVLVRSRDGVLWGVCRGIAEHTGLDVGVVRAAAVFGFLFTAVPVPLIYLSMALSLPVRERETTDLDWASDSVVLRYWAALCPHVVPAAMWVCLWGGLCLALLGASLACLMLGLLVFAAHDGVFVMSMVLAGVLGSLGTLAPLGVLLGGRERPFAISCTPDALWLQRGSIRAAQRVPLTAVESIQVEEVVRLCLMDGETIEMPLPRDADALTALLEQARRSTHGARAHAAALQDATATRRDLENVLRSAGPQRQGYGSRA